MTEQQPPLDPQTASPFFSILPAEIRHMIYIESWRHDRVHTDTSPGDQRCTLKQHIVKSSNSFTHTPCVVSDQTAHDIRSDRLAALPPSSPHREIWSGRVENEWAVHWPCMELMSLHDPAGKPGMFMSTLLTCKLMYHEVHPLLYTTLTFVLTDMITATTFLSPTLPLPSRIRPRSLELCLRIPPILPELYSPSNSNGVQTGPPPSLPHNFPFTRTDNPWSRLCLALSRLPDLRHLTIWLDHKNLTPWGEKIYERSFLHPLDGVRVSKGRRWRLALPRVEDDGLQGRKRRWKQKDLERSRVKEEYLAEGEEVVDRPFVVVRGERPDYWTAHLSRVRARTEGVLMIEGPPGV